MRFIVKILFFLKNSFFYQIIWNLKKYPLISKIYDRISNQWWIKARNTVDETDYKTLFSELHEPLSQTKPLDFMGGRQKPLVLHVNESLNVGGAEVQLMNTLIGLKQFETRLLIIRPSEHALRKTINTLEKTLVENHIAVDLLKSTKSSPALAPRIRSVLDKMPFTLSQDIQKIVDYLLQCQPNIVHAWQDAVGIKSALAALMAGVPTIIIAWRSVNPSHFQFYENYMKEAYLFLGQFENVYFLNNSEHGAIDYGAWLNWNSKQGLTKIKVIYNGVNFDWIDAIAAAQPQHSPQKSLNQKTIKIGSLFRFSSVKRPFLWIEIAADVLKTHTGKTPLQFQLMGYGALKSQMIKKIKNLGLEHWITIVDSNNESEESIAFLKDLDIFLFTSEHEGTPNVLIEAQYLGVPVLAFPAGGLIETLVDVEHSLIFDQKNAVEKLIALIDALENKGQVTTTHAASVLRSKFGLETMIHRLEALYQSVCPTK